MILPLLGITATICHAQNAAPIEAASDPRKWELKWHDEFDKDGLPDKKNWDYEVGFVRNKEAQYYTAARAANARVENGSLIIESLKEEFPNAAYQAGSDNWRKSAPTAHYTSASLITKDRKDFKYGRMEVRAKLPGGNGSWPAIWLLGTDREWVSWPDCGEIDIMEHVGYDTLQVYGTMHAQALHPQPGGKPNYSKGGIIKTTADILDNYHIYAIEWYEDRVDFFLDSNKYFTYSFKEHKDDIVKGIFNKPFYLLLNNAIGGEWGGKRGIDDSSFPQKYYIDYVRYFREKKK